MDFLVTIIELLNILNYKNCIRNHHTNLIDVQQFGQNYKVATLSTFYLIVSGIIKLSLKIRG